MTCWRHMAKAETSTTSTVRSADATAIRLPLTFFRSCVYIAAAAHTGEGAAAPTHTHTIEWPYLIVCAYAGRGSTCEAVGDGCAAADILDLQSMHRASAACLGGSAGPAVPTDHVV